MRSGGWSLEVFDFFDNSLTDNKEDSASSYSVRRSDFCNKSASDLSRSLGSNYLEVNGKFAIQAFEKCVSDTNADIVYMDYSLIGNGEGQLISAALHRRVSGKASSLSYDIVGFDTTPSDTADCKIQSKDFADSLKKGEVIKISATPATISCVKNTDSTIKIDLVTSEGAFSIISPSNEERENKQLLELKAEVARLGDQLRDAEILIGTNLNAVDGLGDDVVSVSSEVDQLIKSSRVIFAPECPQGYRAFTKLGMAVGNTAIDKVSAQGWEVNPGIGPWVNVGWSAFHPLICVRQ